MRHLHRHLHDSKQLGEWRVVAAFTAEAEAELSIREGELVTLLLLQPEEAPPPG